MSISNIGGKKEGKHPGVVRLVGLGDCYFCKSLVYKGDGWDLIVFQWASRLRCAKCKKDKQGE